MIKLQIGGETYKGKLKKRKVIKISTEMTPEQYRHFTEWKQDISHHGKKDYVVNIKYRTDFAIGTLHNCHPTIRVDGSVRIYFDYYTEGEQEK